MSNGSFFNDGHAHGYHESDAPLTGPDGQLMLAMVGDLGDTLVSSGVAPSGSPDSGSAPISSPTGSGAGLVINVTYDQPTTSLPNGFVAAVNYVVSYYESLFTTPTTVNIDVGYGEIGGQTLESNALGESESFLAGYSYSAVKTALAKSDPSAAASLPTSQPVSGTMWLATSEAKALGLTPAQPTTALDGYVGLSSTLPFTYDPNNRAVAGDYDFIGVVEHEFSEVMGRIDLFGETIGSTAAYSLLDMFHYTSSGAHTYTGTTPNYFSADGGHTDLVNFNSNPSGDLGDWASSAGADSYLAFSPSGQLNGISPGDVTAMNALGYQGTLSLPQTVIESFGSTSLVVSGGHYLMDPVGGGTGPEISYQGTTIVAGNWYGWNAIGAEATSTGYEVAWQHGSDNEYAIYQTDSNGNYLSGGTVLTGTSNTLETAETSFHQDLNGDGTIGVPAGGGGTSTTIESFGSTSLVVSGGHYLMDPVGGGTGPEISYQGTTIVAGNWYGWNAIGAEATSTGYEVAWQHGSDNEYAIYQTDSNGNYLSGGTVLTGTSNTLETAETSFHQDLNGDGTIGVPAGGGGTSTTIESFGSTSLVVSGGHYLMDPVGGGTGPEISYQGTTIVAGNWYGWNAIGAEATSTGYEVAWQHGSDNEYAIYQTDSNGNYLSGGTVLTGTSNTLETAETSFHQDLNGDGTIGVPAGGGTIAAAQPGPSMAAPATEEAPLIGLASQSHTTDHG